MMGGRFWLVFAVVAGFTAIASAQTPQPFPKPGDSSRPPPSPPPSQKPAPPVKVLPPEQSSTTQAAPGEPTEQMLGLPIYPGAQFIASYDAGRGQRYYLFGTNASFAELVAYYRTMLKQRGELVFEAPAIHMFDVGRFREETMAFPPGVTIKDYGPDGYLNPKRGVEPARFKTIIQLVPVPPVTPK